MAQGLTLPLTPDQRGRARLARGSAYLRQVIMTGLSSCMSRNPFQRGGGIDIGIDEGVVFQTNNAVADALARRGIIRFFTRLRSSGLARLAPGEGIKFSRSGGELQAEVTYFDLEADREDTVNSSLSGSGRSAPATSGRAGV